MTIENDFEYGCDKVRDYYVVTQIATSPLKVSPSTFILLLIEKNVYKYKVPSERKLLLLCGPLHCIEGNKNTNYWQTMPQLCGYSLPFIRFDTIPNPTKVLYLKCMMRLMF